MLSRKNRFVALISSALSLFLLKYIIDHSVETLPQVLQLVAYASLPISGGLIALSSCSLLKTFLNAKNRATSPLLRWISEDQASDFFLGFVTVAYLSLIRTPVAAYVPFLPYLEWIAVALVVYVIYTITRQSAEEFYISSQVPSLKKHTQQIRRETGRDLIRITSVMEQFVNHGVKEPLLISLTLHLQRLGKTEEVILKTLNPLIEYQENSLGHKLYYLLFPWTKRKLAKRNMKAREDLLKNLMKKINEL